MTARNSAPGEAYAPAVPVLCTDPNLAAHTRVRGTAVIVDPDGMLLTAGHVIVDSPRSCVLTILAPLGGWSNSQASQAFFVRDCATESTLDIAVCRFIAVERGNRRISIPPAKLQTRFPAAPSAVTITGFWGWGLFPVARKGQVKSHDHYRRADGNVCDFATDVPVFEGMSGSPVVSAEGAIVGLITTAGTRKFAGTSFGISMEGAAGFLRAHGVKLTEGR